MSLVTSAAAKYEKFLSFSNFCFLFVFPLSQFQRFRILVF